ncbi:MAG: VWA domain-containing protein, partial [Woeseiaceae bacterium]
EEKEKMQGKVAATEKLHEGASLASRARRGAFNASAGGRANLLGENELIAAVASGSVDLNELEEDALPEALKPMAHAEQEAFVAGLTEQRVDLQRQIRELSLDRDGYLAKKVEEAGGLKDSLDQKLYDAVKSQASEVGLEYEDGPTY